MSRINGFYARLYLKLITINAQNYQLLVKNAQNSGEKAKTARFTFLQGMEPETILAKPYDPVDTGNTSGSRHALLRGLMSMSVAFVFYHVSPVPCCRCVGDERSDALRDRRRRF